MALRARSQLTLPPEFLAEGIRDTQGTIHANDSKCSAALITHGLLFAAVVTASANAARLYPKVHGTLPILALVFGGLAVIAFVASIMALLLAVMPYRPTRLARRIVQDHQPPRVFFIEGVPRRSVPAKPRDPVSSRLEAVRQLAEEKVTLELVCESVKLAAVREHDAQWAQRGYIALMIEVVLVVIYLGLVTAGALTTV